MHGPNYFIDLIFEIDFFPPLYTINFYPISICFVHFFGERVTIRDAPSAFSIAISKFLAKSILSFIESSLGSLEYKPRFDLEKNFEY